MSSFILHSYRTVTPEGVQNAYVIIKNGVIADVLNAVPENYSQPVISVGDKVLMPGVIDPHVHINEPGRTEWEGFDTATAAAVVSGVTTLVDMPLNSSPVTTTARAFDAKLHAAQNKLHCNCGFWGGIVPGNKKEIEPLIENGVLGFKAFLTHSGIDEFANVTEDDLRKAMPVIARYRLPLLVHCETSPPTPLQQVGEGSPLLQSVTSSLLSVFDGEGLGVRYQHYLSSRPKKWEDDAIALMIRLCEEYNCPVHIVHLSSANSIEQIQKAKEKGVPLTVETGQHYLFFSAEEIEDGRTEFKCAPPIREKENNEKLWQALKNGIIDFVATDYSPSTPELKELQSGNFMKAWGGIASIQFALPALWTAARMHNCSIADVIKWLCENPAKLPGLENAKGKIQSGFDADLIVWDPDKTFTVTESIIRHRHKVTPYLNRELYGVTEQVFLKGEKVFENGELLQKNKGEIIVRTQ